MKKALLIDRVDRRKRPRKTGRPASAGSFGGAKAVDPREMGKLGAARRWSPEHRSVVATMRELTPDARRVLGEIINSKTAKEADRIRAIEVALAYGHGRPAQQIDLSVSGPRDLLTLSTADLEAIAITGQAPFQLEHAGQVIGAEVYEVPAEYANVANSAEARAGSVPRSVHGGTTRE